MSRMVRVKVVASSVGLMLLLLGAPMEASTISFSRFVPPVPNDFTEAVTFPRFDPGVGTLTEAVFRLVPRAQGDHGFENTGAAPLDPAGVRTDVQFELDDGGALGLGSLVSGALFAQFTAPTGSFDGVVDFGGDSGSTVSFDTPGEPPSEFFGVFTAPGELSAFLGPGSFGAEFSSTATVTPIGASSVVVTGASRGSATLELTYHFERVPEPGHLSLMALAILGWIGTRRASRLNGHSKKGDRSI